MNHRLYLLPIVVALVMSYISSRYLFIGSAANLLPWGILALLFGIIARDKSQAVRLGAVYGFSQAFIFLWIDKAGKITLIQFFLLMLIISSLALGAASCAALAASISYKMKSFYKD